MGNNPLVDHMLQDDKFMEFFAIWGKLDDVNNLLDEIKLNIASVDGYPNNAKEMNIKLFYSALARLKEKVEGVEKAIEIKNRRND